VVAGDEALKVVFIQASLNLPYDHRIHVQNFTVQVSLTQVAQLLFARLGF